MVATLIQLIITALIQTIDTYSINAKVQIDPILGASGGRPLKPETTPPRPDKIVTYCLPFLVQVIGCALIPDGVLNCQYNFTFIGIQAQ
jgi:hypothetical protein